MTLVFTFLKMDATDEAYLLMPSTYLVRGKRESEFLWAPVIVIALVFVFVFFSLIFEVRRIVHQEQVATFVNLILQICVTSFMDALATLSRGVWTCISGPPSR